MNDIDMLIEPAAQEWPRLLKTAVSGGANSPTWQGRTRGQWAQTMREDLGVTTGVPIVATGHQTLMWHPGILAKYIALDRFAAEHGYQRINVLVDQHVGGFDILDVPVRDDEGFLDVITVNICHTPASRDERLSEISRRAASTSSTQGDTPMGVLAPFLPQRDLSLPPGVHPALPSVAEGWQRIVNAIERASGAPNASRQMSAALCDLMHRWVAPMPAVSATQMLCTRLGAALLEEMARNPGAMCEHYNSAVADHPQAGIAPLEVYGPGDGELPLWRVDNNGRRVRAQLIDVVRWLADPPDAGDEALTGVKPLLMPRALLMTSLIRIGLCDLFIHGTGGAVYDRAMEQWIHNWIGLSMAPNTIVTASVQLPFEQPPGASRSVADEVADRHRFYHDPSATTTVEPVAPDCDSHDWQNRSDCRRDRQSQLPSEEKRLWLERIAALPPQSRQRRECFFAMHKWLEEERKRHLGALSRFDECVRRARRAAEESAIRSRRDWAFAFYPPEQLDALATEMAEQFTAAEQIGR